MLSPGKELKVHRGDESQEEFGKKFGASQAQVSRIESGSCPTLEQALAIHKLIGIAVERWPWDGAMAAFIKQQRRTA